MPTAFGNDTGFPLLLGSFLAVVSSGEDVVESKWGS